MKLKKALIIIFCVIVSFIANLMIFSYAKDISGDNIELYKLINIILLVLFPLLFLINLFTTYFLFKKRKFPICKLETWSLQWKDNVQHQYRKALNKARVLVILSFAYTVLLIAGFLFASFVQGYAEAEGFLMLISVFLLPSLMYILLAPSNEEQVVDIILNRDTFPLLYQIASKACKTTRCKKILRLSYTESDIFVVKKAFTISIMLNPSIVRLLTEDELYNVLLYKISLVTNSEKRRENFYRSIERKWDTFYSLKGKIFTSTIQQKALDAIKQYRYFSPYRQEMLANDKASKLGDVQQIVNGIAKIEMYKLYKNGENRVMNYEIYSSETPTQDWYTKDIAEFISAKNKFGEVWTNQLTTQLPSFKDGSQTLNMRMKYLRCHDFDTTPAVHPKHYLEEVDKLITAGNQLMAKKLQHEYQTTHNKLYNERKKQFQVFRLFKQHNAVADYKLIQCCKSLLNVDNQKVAEMASYLAEQQSSWGYYLLAMTYFAVNDERCVDLFEKAMSIDLLAIECINNIGQFAINSGNQQLFDQYSQRVTQIVEKTRENRVNRAWVDEITFDECTIELPVKKQLIESLLHELGEHINEIYMASYRKNNVRTNVVMVIFKPQSDENKQKELFAEMSEIITAFARNDIVPPSTIFYNNQLNAIQQFKESLVYRSQNNRQ